MNLAKAMGVPHGQWCFFVYMDTLAQHTCSHEGVLQRDKYRSKYEKAMRMILRSYYSSLKVTGGTYAGNEDKTGEPDLDKVCAQLAEDDPDKSIDDKYTIAAEYLSSVLLVDLREGHLQRGQVDKFKECIDASGADINLFTVMNTMMRDLMPLEALILGPSTCLELDR